MVAAGHIYIIGPFVKIFVSYGHLTMSYLSTLRVDFQCFGQGDRMATLVTNPWSVAATVCSNPVALWPSTCELVFFAQCFNMFLL